MIKGDTLSLHLVLMVLCMEVIHLHFTFTSLSPVTREQQSIAIELLASIGRNSETAVESHTYGNWIDHLRDHLEDSVIDQSTES